MKPCIVILATLIASVSLGADAPSWTEFWHSVRVDPPPPAGFLDAPPFHGRILNLTTGRLSDDVVRQWVEADLRRGAADSWAARNLRRDIADAGIFGPPGLNGTSESIDRERSKYAVRIDATNIPETLAVGVIWVSAEDRRVYAKLGLTEYVIVQLRRTMPGQRFRVFGNGAREALETAKPGEFRWQLDTGHFFTHPVLGPLWYQQTGFRCMPDDGTRIGEICARVKP